MADAVEYPLEPDAFTVEGYNDRPKPCPRGSKPRGRNKPCRGTVYPTFNANIGQCDTCKERFAWSILQDA